MILDYGPKRTDGAFLPEGTVVGHPFGLIDFAIHTSGGGRSALITSTERRRGGVENSFLARISADSAAGVLVSTLRTESVVLTQPGASYGGRARRS